MGSADNDRAANPPVGAWTVFLVFLRLGLTSFGGPIAHLGYFRDEFVTRRRWLGERSYADLVALCQFLPGPASSQVGMAIGLSRAGFPGALAAWAGFTLPSAIALILFAIGVASWGNALPAGALHGLKVVAVAVVAQALWGMACNLCTDSTRVTIAAVAACVTLLWPTAWGQVGMITSAAVVVAGSCSNPSRMQATIHCRLPSVVAWRPPCWYFSLSC
jgi:chromate transporter